MTALSFLFIVIFLSANAYFAYKVSILFRMAKAAGGPVWGGNRLDRIPERIGTFLMNVIGQRATARKRAVGIMHAAIFWGFLIITVETMENFGREAFPGFTFEFLGPTIYSGLVGLQDLFTLLVLVAVVLFFYRRLILRPEGLGKSKDAIIILALTGSMMISLFGMRAFHMVAQPRWYDAYAFVSAGLNHWFVEPFALAPETAGVINGVFRWIHHLIVLGFLVYIPSSKHLHILTAAPNTFLRTLDVPKAMRKIRLDDESATSFGVSKVTDLSWKDVLDLFACTECGRCQDVCPASNTQKPLSPKAIVLDLKDVLYQNKQALLAGKKDEAGPVLGTRITDDVIWACTSCRACETACPVFIEQTDKIYEIRRNMVLMESRFPPELQTVFKNIENNFSPWAMSPEDRDKWAEGLAIKTMAEVVASGEDIEYLFWVGCAGSFDDRNKKVSRALVSLLRKAGVKFAILGKEEKCTGDPVRRMGNEYLAQSLIQENVNTLNNYKVRKVVTACPHCFNAIRNEWKDFGGSFEVIHHTQLLAKLIKEGRLKPTKGSEQKITYHDSCYIGRWNNEYDAPRTLLRSLPMARVEEMEKSGSNAMCCGAGGGRMWMEEKIGSRINIKRTEQALATNAGVIASNCPFCMTMITDGVKAKEMAEKVKVVDLAELVDQATV